MFVVVWVCMVVVCMGVVVYPVIILVTILAMFMPCFSIVAVMLMSFFSIVTVMSVIAYLMTMAFLSIVAWVDMILFRILDCSRVKCKGNNQNKIYFTQHIFSSRGFYIVIFHVASIPLSLLEFCNWYSPSGVSNITPYITMAIVGLLIRRSRVRIFPGAPFSL
jgi:hypothetical protein